MKSLVVFYSRSGNTKKIGLEIAQILKADTEEIIDLKNRKGAIGFITGGFAGVFKRQTKIKQVSLNPLNYDLLVIGSPIWAGNMTPAIRKFLSQLDKEKLKKIAFFCTCSNSNGKCFSDMKKLSKHPLAALEIKDKKVKTDEYKDLVSSFCEKLK
jgi:flavodoxin